MTRTRTSRRTLIAVSVALAALFAVGTATARGGLRDLLSGAEVIETEADGRLDRLDRELRGMRGLSRSISNRGERREMRKRIARMDRLIDELRDDTNALAQLVVQAADEVRPRSRDRRHAHGHGDTRVSDRHDRAPRSACSHGDFTQVLSMVQAEWFDSGKMEVLQAAVASRWFTVGQVKTLVGQFSFDSYQIDAAAMLHGRTVDLQNWYEVYGVLTFDSSKRELRRRVGV